MTRPQKLLSILAALCVALAALAYLQDLARTGTGDSAIVSLGHVRDESGRLRIGDMESATFAPVSGDFHGGYDSAPQWFRLIIAPRVDPTDLVLQISTNQLERVDLYRLTPTGWSVSRGGATVPFTEREVQLLPPSFPLTATDFGKPLFLRVQGTSSLGFGLRAIDRTLATSELAHRLTLHVLYFSALGMGVLLALLRLRLVPDALSVAILGFMGSYFVYSLEVLGYAQVLVAFPDPDLHLHIMHVSAILAVLASMLMHRLYLGRYGPSRLVLHLCDVTMVVQTLVFVPLATGYGDWVGLPTMVLSLLGLVWVVALLATIRIPDPTHRRMLYGLYAAWLCVTALWLSSRLGLIGLQTFSRPFVEVYGLNSLFIVIAIMALDRAIGMREHRATQIALVTAEATQAANLRNAAIQNSFMHMLVHELRNNLSVLQMSVPNLPRTAATAQITDTIRDLDRSLAEARYATMLANGTWQKTPRPLALVDALVRVIDDLGCLDRIEVQGEDADVTVMADEDLLGAALETTLGVFCQHPFGDGPTLVTLSASSTGILCHIAGPEVATGPDAPRRPQKDRFALAAMLLRQIDATLAVLPLASSRITIAIEFPAPPFTDTGRSPVSGQPEESLA